MLLCDNPFSSSLSLKLCTCMARCFCVGVVGRVWFVRVHFQGTRALVHFLGAISKLRKAIITFVTSVVFLSFGYSPQSEFYGPMFRSTRCSPSVTDL